MIQTQHSADLVPLFSEPMRDGDVIQARLPHRLTPSVRKVDTKISDGSVYALVFIPADVDIADPVRRLQNQAPRDVRPMRMMT